MPKLNIEIHIEAPQEEWERLYKRVREFDEDKVREQLMKEKDALAKAVSNTTNPFQFMYTMFHGEGEE